MLFTRPTWSCQRDGAHVFHDAVCLFSRTCYSISGKGDLNYFVGSLVLPLLCLVIIEIIKYSDQKHVLVFVTQAMSLNVAVNSHSNVLITILLSNQFMELKVCAFVGGLSCLGRALKQTYKHKLATTHTHTHTHFAHVRGSWIRYLNQSSDLGIV